MPSKAQVDDVRETARGRLIAAAAERFAQHGFASTSVRDICKAAGVTQPALYWHFRNKEGIYLAVLEEAMRIHREVVALALGRGGSAKARILRVLETAADLVGRNRDILLVIQAALFGVTQGAPAFDLATPRKRLRKALQRLVEEGMALGEFRNGSAGDMADALLGVLDVQLRAIRAGASPRAARRGIQRVSRVVFDGILDRRR
jgi:AcrR family transcriptional regulator